MSEAAAVDGAPEKASASAGRLETGAMADGEKREGGEGEQEARKPRFGSDKYRLARPALATSLACAVDNALSPCLFRCGCVLVCVSFGPM